MIRAANRRPWGSLTSGTRRRDQRWNEDEFYYDNFLVADIALTNPGGDIQYVGSPQLAIGERSVTALGEPYQGAVNDVAIYDHALSLAEINSLFNNPAGTPTMPITEVAWRSDASEDWNASSSWTPGLVPNADPNDPNLPRISAVLGDAITADHTVFTDKAIGQLKTAMRLTDSPSLWEVRAGRAHDDFRVETQPPCHVKPSPRLGSTLPKAPWPIDPIKSTRPNQRNSPQTSGVAVRGTLQLHACTPPKSIGKGRLLIQWWYGV